MTARAAKIERKTKETEISLALAIDGTGASTVATGVGFFDHMLTHLAKHSLMDLTVKATGDLHIDDHHTVEDVSLVLGAALDKATRDEGGNLSLWVGGDSDGGDAGGGGAGSVRAAGVCI